MSGTKIEWATETWNPIIGCSKISSGCENCYAERMARRQCYVGEKKPGTASEDYMAVVKPDWQDDSDGGRAIGWCGWNEETAFRLKEFGKPTRWRKPRMVFVCSMGDLFHESVRKSWIDDVICMIDEHQQHTFVLLTKRPDRMRSYFGGSMPPMNIWLGVTAENQAEADDRIPTLLYTPATMHFVSCEPLLGPVDLLPYLERWQTTLDWVIVGGETGPGARKMDEEWAMNICDDCVLAGVPFFFKKHGSASGKPKDQQRLLDGRTFDEWPEAKRDTGVDGVAALTPKWEEDK